MNVEIPGKLFIKLKELKAQYKINFADIFVLLISQIPRPEEYQSNYKIFEKGELLKHLDIRMNDDQKMKIVTFAAAFENLHHAIDYLLVEEKKIRMNRVTSFT